jgi:hypothetical protein
LIEIKRLKDKLNLVKSEKSLEDKRHFKGQVNSKKESESEANIQGAPSQL